jgi:hypothetical protein
LAAGVSEFPTDYFAQLRNDGILVDGNENYLLGLAMIVCNLHNAGYDDDGPIGDYIARRENIPNIKGYDIALDADVWYCSRLHPQLVPPTPRSRPRRSSSPHRATATATDALRRRGLRDCLLSYSAPQ